MAATRENVLAAIAQYVETNKRRAPSHEIALAVHDTVPNVQAIIKTLVIEGSINASRGRNGGALPDGVVLEKKSPAKKAAKVEATPAEEVAESVQPDDDTAEQFAALMAQLDRESESIEAVAQ